MRFLFVSNYYPPRARGGYEQWCHEVAVELSRRGHQLCVLTSDGQGGPIDKTYSDDAHIDVRRVLHLEVESGLLSSALRLLTKRSVLEEENLVRVRQAVAEFKPDAALIWGTWNVPRSVPALIEDLLGCAVAYYLCDYWPSLPSAYVQQWQAPPRRSLTGLPKQLLGRPIVARLNRQSPIQLRFDNPICVSHAVRKRLASYDARFEHAQVIYGGTRVYEFSPRVKPASSERPKPLKLLYAGRVTPTKGIHTAIRALALLVRDMPSLPVRLDIVGSADAAYEADLVAQVQANDLANVIRFRGPVARGDMPGVLQQYDVLLLLSEWEEPFARVVLEGMAAGLAVVGTTTGGTTEILLEDQTGLTFKAGDAVGLGNQIRRLVAEPQLRWRLGDAGRRCVEQSFTFARMVDELEQALERISAPIGVR